jgi:bacillopeptidase F
LISNSDQPHEVIVLLQEQAPLDQYLLDIKKTISQRDDLRKQALREMQDVASQAQPAFIEWLNTDLNIQHDRLTKFWVFNAIGLKATAEEIRAIAVNPGVRFVTEPPAFEEAATTNAQAPLASFDPGQHEEGHDVINAPALWKMGYTGYGTKVYIYDTGIDIDHPALRSNFSYHNNPLEISWKGTKEEPFTCTDHGSHVAGTILGLDREMNDTIGVAFNAQYMMTPQFTSCGSSRLDNIVAWQWMLDPDGDPQTIDEIPHASNMSGGSLVTDTICGNELIGLLFQGFQIGNVAAIFAGGNEGPADSSHRSPAVHNFDLVHAFAVGNLNASTLEINGSSSRGPSFCAGTASSLEIKPEVSAPGTSVRSSIVGGGYDWFTGTSMAAPHVTGAFLLLKEAFPFLLEGDILMALYLSATDFGQPGEDNEYGMGVIDVLAAFNHLVDQGHQPVPPLANDKDLVAIDMDFDRQVYCSVIPMMNVKFENAGLDTLFTVQLDFVETNGQLASFSKEWTGTLPPDEVVDMEFELPVEASSGYHELTMQLSIPGTDEEVRTLNNQFKKRFRVFDEEGLSIQNALPDPQTICTGTRLLLQTNTNLNASQQIYWYNNELSTHPDGEGPRFLTPPVFENAEFYAELEEKHQAGQTLDEANIEFTDESLGGLIFDVERPLVIERVKVHSGTSGGGRMLQLFDPNGESVISKLAIVSAGEKTIELNWQLDTPGKGYRFEITTGKPLAHVSNGIQFPIEVNDLISIQSGIYDGVQTTESYYYFFDWEISAKHPCGPAVVEVMIEQADTIGIIEILSESDTVYLSNGGIVELNAEGDGFSSYEWDLGNAILDIGQTVNAEYFEPGVYLVILDASSENGCSTTAVKEITVIDDLQTGIEDPAQTIDYKVFPNPASGKLYVQIINKSSSLKQHEVFLFDLLGRKHLSKTLDFTSGIVELDVHSVSAGQYIVKVNGKNAIVVIQ